jgi:hypothetical protein
MENTTDIGILYLLLQATQKGLMVWKNCGDDDRGMFASQIGTDSFEIELVNLQRAGENVCERSLARIQGRKIYKTYSIGTIGYDILERILEENAFGWKEASSKSENALLKLKKRLEDTIAEQSAAPLTSALEGPLEGTR